MNTKSVIVNAVGAAAAVAVGGAVLMGLVKTRPEAPRNQHESTALLVETTSVESTSAETRVNANGQLIAAERVILAPQVSGRVRWQSDALVPGGRFARNERILRIDATDYSLAVEQRTAEVNRARLELQLEQGRQRVAQHEWEALGAEGASEDGEALALRQPQVETAEVGVRAAASAVRRAQLDLARTTLRAPFNAMVVQENVDRGQLVGPTSQLATIVGTDHFWVQVSIPVEALASIRIPDRDGEGSSAVVRQRVGENLIERPGRVLRLLPDVDPVGAMARILVEIDDPLGLSDDYDGSLPMLLGSYAEVELEASVLQNVIEVPRAALREGSQVFVANESDELEIRDVNIAWRREDSVLVNAGLSAGERIITSRVPTPVAGLALRTGPAPASPMNAPEAE